MWWKVRNKHVLVWAELEQLYAQERAAGPGRRAAAIPRRSATLSARCRAGEVCPRR